jgi:hypothetical protein
MHPAWFIVMEHISTLFILITISFRAPHHYILHLHLDLHCSNHHETLDSLIHTYFILGTSVSHLILSALHGSPVVHKAVRIP